MPEFPISPLLPDIRDSLVAHPRLVLEAPPGAGKTTQVPLALLDAPWLSGGKIVMLEPRRVAARAAAAFMAKQLGEAVGDTVGYRIRFERKVSARTRIEVVTEGILTRMLQDDPMLDGIGALLFDEFHERHLSGDLGLALALDVQGSLRGELRIVVMSATLDGQRLAQFLDAPRLSSAGRSFPVEIAHFPARREELLEAQARRAVEHALATHPGDVLVFLPGRREIARTQAALEAALLPPLRRQGRVGEGLRKRLQDFRKVAPAPTRPPPNLPLPSQGEGQSVVLQLHGDLPVDQQSQALQPDPHGRRRVVLATNVAESSVTLPGVRVVIDSGLAREPRYDPNSGFSRLDVFNISQASADQRAGRAGRVAEGWAYRLWPQSQRLEPQRRAEITQVELAGLALELAGWGSAALRFVDPPPPGALAAARELLRRLGALDAAHAITPFGRRMLALGTHPRLAAMLLSARNDRDRALACDLAALIEARDPLRPQAGMPRSDALAERWRALAAFRNNTLPSGRRGGPGRGVGFSSETSGAHTTPSQPPGQSAQRFGAAPRTSQWLASACARPPAFAGGGAKALAAIDAAAKQWRRRLRIDHAPPRDVEAHALGDLLAHAFPDRIAYRHPTDPRRYQLSNGRMATLFDDSALRGEPWLVASELRFEARDALILRAAPLDERYLRAQFAAHFSDRDETRWDAARRALVAERVQRFDGIVLDTRPAGRVDPAQAAQALSAAVRDLGLDALPWSDGLRQWRTRAQCLREWMPELGLPDLGDAALLATLDAWLRPAFDGKTRLDALQADELAEVLKSPLDWTRRQRIEQLAPTQITVPSGQQRRIAYALDDDGKPASPVLAVKLQELFGLADTPRICDGRMPLTVHLLSPAGRPLQVTGDLRSFWQNTYPEVRKEMKGRYPKHPWPEDPWNAVATHRAKPRGT